jgi:hypothetical protein
MLELKSSSVATTFTCPDCGCKFGQSKTLIFQGTHVIADCECECCENHYYHTVPSGHSTIFPISFSQKTRKTRFDEKVKVWLANPLIQSIRANDPVDKPVSKKVFRETKEIILLNCLDSCYGHVFLKLLNAQKDIREFPAKGVVVMLPASFEWLLPKGIAEAWLVEAKLSDFNKRILNLDSFVKEEMKRFDSVLLSKAPIHPDISKIEMTDFLKTEKFDLNQFEEIPLQITFILREDRFWTNNRLDAFLMLLSISKGWMAWMKSYFILRQNSLIKKLVKEINKKTDRKIHFSAAGLGKTGSLGTSVKDFRKETIDEKGEKQWCELYAQSHLVIGIHGSNMLIPTALSAGFIELLPKYKIANLTEDIAMNHKGRYMQFLGRHLDEYSSVQLVAEHAVSMVEDFSFLKRNTEA